MLSKSSTSIDDGGIPGGDDLPERKKQEADSQSERRDSTGDGSAEGLFVCLGARHGVMLRISEALFQL